jgi:methyl-accepting chemotaxis protein
MKWTVGAKIGGGFGLALVIVVVLGAVTWRSTTGLLGTADYVAQSYRTHTQLADVLSLLNGAESSQRGFILTGQDYYLEPYRTARASVNEGIEGLKKLIGQDANQQRRLEVLGTLVASRWAELDEAIELRRSKGFEAASQAVQMDTEVKLVDEIQKLVHDLNKDEDVVLKRREQEAKASGHHAIYTVFVGILLSFTVLTAAGILITRNIANPLRDISKLAEQIAAGDLRVRVHDNGRRDEVGQLSHTLATMVENLRRTTHQIQEATSVLAGSATGIVSAVTSIASGANDTAAAVTETATTVEEVKQTAAMSNQKAKLVSENAQRSVLVSQTGEKSVEETIAGMNRIREQMESIAGSIVRLSEQSQAIGDIISTVNDLAEQSNLLAVNASIEAARAGDQGKGFAVVAQEVKILAEQSKSATSQVRTILSDIQKATSAAVMAIEQGGKAVEAGVKQSTEAGGSIQSLARNVVEAAQAIVQIEASSRQQLQGMDQVAAAMENIKLASGQNVDSMNRVEAAAQNLHELGQTLKQMVEHYKV